MQLKPAIAACLSLILLCGSSLASGCELVCCLSPSHPAHQLLSVVPGDPAVSPAASAGEAAASAMVMAHSHCGHARMTQGGGAITQHFEDAARCATAPCLQPEMLSSSLSVKNNAQIKSQHRVLVALVSAMHSSGDSFARVKRKAVRSQFSPVDPLSVALRI